MDTDARQNGVSRRVAPITTVNSSNRSPPPTKPKPPKYSGSPARKSENFDTDSSSVVTSSALKRSTTGTTPRGSNVGRLSRVFEDRVDEQPVVKSRNLKLSPSNFPPTRNLNVSANPQLAGTRGKIITPEDGGIDESPIQFCDIKARFQQATASGEVTLPARPPALARNLTNPSSRQAPATTLPPAPLTCNTQNLPSYNRMVTRNSSVQSDALPTSRSLPTTPVSEKTDPFADDDDIENNSKEWVDVTDFNLDEYAPRSGHISPSVKSPSKLNPTRWGRSSSQNSTQSSKKNHTSISTSSSQIENRPESFTGSPGSITPSNESEISFTEGSQHSPENSSRPDNPPRLPIKQFTTEDTNSWYSSHSNETSSSTLVEEDEQSREMKRRRRLWNSIKELVDTERIFLADMQLLKKEYYVKAEEVPIFNQYDLKVIFNNIDEVIAFSSEFLELLTAAGVQDSDNDDIESHAINDNEKTWIGDAFRSMLEGNNRMEEVYGEYCKRYDASVARLQEFESDEYVQSFLQKCKERCEGLTRSWDIASLLIKPVQRVLKYPLLLNQIFTLTKPTHEDYEHLKVAFTEATNVAERINEIKRRKDIVEKIVGSKKKTDADIVHGITKSITRRAQTIRNATGIAKATEDQLYNVYVEKFKKWEQNGIQLERDVREWLKSIRQYFEDQEKLAASIAGLYLLGDVRNEKFKRAIEYRNAVASFGVSCGKELDEAIKKNIFPQIEAFLERFKAPAAVMRKRDRKVLDYDRALIKAKKGETPDKSLQQSADAFVSIRDQLHEELPKFFELMTQYFGIIVQEFVGIQSRFYHQMGMDFKQFFYKYIEPSALEKITDERHVILREMDVTTEYTDAVLKIDDLMRDFVLVNNPGVFPDSDLDRTESKRRDRSSTCSEAGNSSESSRQPEKVRHHSVSQDNPRSNVLAELPKRYSGSSFEEMLSTWNLNGTYSSLSKNVSNSPRGDSDGIKNQWVKNSGGHKKYATDGEIVEDQRISQSTIVVDYGEGTNNAKEKVYNDDDDDDDDDDDVFHDTLTGEETADEDNIEFACVTHYAFHPKNSTELAFEARAVLQVIRIIVDDKGVTWWYCINTDTGGRGWVDPGYCEKLD